MNNFPEPCSVVTWIPFPLKVSKIRDWFGCRNLEHNDIGGYCPPPVKCLLTRGLIPAEDQLVRTAAINTSVYCITCILRHVRCTTKIMAITMPKKMHSSNPQPSLVFSHAAKDMASSALSVGRNNHAMV